MNLPEAVELFAAVFQANPDKLGVQTAHNLVAGHAKKTARTYTLSKKIDRNAFIREHIRNHLTTESYVGRIGWLPGSEKDTRFGVIDIDRKEFNEDTDNIRQRVEEALREKGIPTLRERTPNGGWHVFIYTDDPVPYAVMRGALKSVLAEIGHPGIETYPMGRRSTGRWIFLPYAGIFREGVEHGLTYLELDDGTPVEFIELPDILAAHQAPAHRVQDIARGQPTEDEEPVGDDNTDEDIEPLAHQAVDMLKKLTLKPPNTFARHDTIFAFINLGDRAGAAEVLRDWLQTEKVYTLWVTDGSRTLSEWRKEIERIYESVVAAEDVLQRRFGVKYLIENGWKVPPLPRDLTRITTAQAFSRLGDDALARWTTGRLHQLGIPMALSNEELYVYNGNTWYVSNVDRQTILKRRILDHISWPEGIDVSEPKLNRLVARMVATSLVQPISPMPDMVAVGNGILNLRTGELNPPDPALTTIGRLRADWEPTMTDDEETELLKDLDEYCMTVLGWDGSPDVVAETYRQEYYKAWAWALDPGQRGRWMIDLNGDTSTGKSTLARVGMMVFGDGSREGPDSDAYGVTLAMSKFIGTSDAYSHLVGKNVVYFDDLMLNRKTQDELVELLKTITTGSGFVVNRKFISSKVVYMSPRILFSTNRAISVNDPQEAMALQRRIVRIVVNRNSLQREQMIPNYEQILLPTQRTKNAFLRRIVRYWREYEENDWRYSTPEVPEIRLRTMEEIVENDDLVSFLVERVTHGPKLWVDNNTLRAAYNAWAEGNQGRVLSPTDFAYRMRTAKKILAQVGLTVTSDVRRSAAGKPIRGWKGIGF